MDSIALVGATFAVLHWMRLFAGSQGDASLPVPTLSLSTPFSTFLSEELILLKCKPPAGRTGLSFSFCQMNTPNQWTIYKEQTENYFIIPTTELKSKETFSCFYKTEYNSGRSFQSPRSNSVAISIIKRPQSPVLSLDPQHPVYILGEEVSLNCTAPKRHHVARYRFVEEGQTQLRRQILLEGEKPYKTIQVDGNTNGTYVCMYWIVTPEGRQIQSEKSNTISIVLRDPPLTPELKVDPPPGGVLQGDTLRITCSSNGNQTEKSFHFYKDGAEIGAPNQASPNCPQEPSGASLKISLSICLQAQPNHSGNYTCRYEESMSGRWVLSPWSQKVNITVSSLIQNSYIPWWAVRFILLLMIPVPFCFTRKVNEPSKEHQEELESGEREGTPL